MRPLIHFEIYLDDPEAGQDFYSQLFDWKISDWEGPAHYLLASTKLGPEGPGINGALAQAGQLKGVINTVSVVDLEACCQKISELGGKLLSEPVEVPGVGLHCYAADPEGNPFGMMQEFEQT